MLLSYILLSYFQYKFLKNQIGQVQESNATLPLTVL